MKENIKKGIIFITTLCICYGLSGCGKDIAITPEQESIVKSYNNDFETSKLPTNIKSSDNEPIISTISNKVTYYDIVKIIKDVNKNDETNKISLDKYLDVLKVNEAYNKYIIVRKEGKDLPKIRKALGEFEEGILKAQLLNLYQVDPETLKSIKISNDWDDATKSGENYDSHVITITTKEQKIKEIKPGGIEGEKIIKESTEKYYISLSRDQMKQIKKLKNGFDYNLDEIDQRMSSLLLNLCQEPYEKCFAPTPWGEKNFLYLQFKSNEKVFKKVIALSYVVEQVNNSKTNKTSQLKNLKKQAEDIKVALKQQNKTLLRYQRRS